MSEGRGGNGIARSEPDHPQPRSNARPTWVCVDLDACVRNLARLKTCVGDRGIWAVVKADAYGHGAVPVARRLATGGVTGFGVATTAEGSELRRAGVAEPVLVLGGIEPVSVELVREVVEHDLSIALWSRGTADQVAALRPAGHQVADRPLRVHVKVDTGMGRLGVRPEAVPELVSALAGVGGVSVEGLFSNLAASDQKGSEPGHAHTVVQIERFADVCARLEAQGHLPRHRHLANSAGSLHFPASRAAAWCTAVRPGLALYGASLTPGRDSIDLAPVLSWWTRVAAVRELPAGWPLGYGLRCRAERPSRIAVLPVGYHDGYDRALSDRGSVSIGGRRAPVVGAVSMDLTLVDVTDFPEVSVGDLVALIGDGIRVEEVAAWAGSIPHEVLCRIGARVPRRHLPTEHGDAGRRPDSGEGSG